jgi:type I restriction-modification system DNA methylase subunit
MTRRGSSKKDRTITNNGATLGFEKRMWEAADALRGSMDAAEYKHVVLGLIFLKYISDSFEEHRARLEAERAQGAEPAPEDTETFEEKMRRLAAQLREQMAEGERLDKQIAADLKHLSFLLEDK